MTESDNDNKPHPADDFVDRILITLMKQNAPYAVREMADKVYRPFLKTIQGFFDDQIDATTVATSIETVNAMMITNFVSLLTKDQSAFAASCQEIVNNTALRINDDLERRFPPKGTPDNVLKLPNAKLPPKKK